MENQNLQSSELCIVTIAFPVDNDSEFMAVKKKISELTKELSRVKVEYRITTMRDNPHGLDNIR